MNNVNVVQRVNIEHENCVEKREINSIVVVVSVNNDKQSERNLIHMVDYVKSNYSEHIAKPINVIVGINLTNNVITVIIVIVVVTISNKTMKDIVVLSKPVKSIGVTELTIKNCMGIVVNYTTVN